MIHENLNTLPYTAFRVAKCEDADWTLELVMISVMLRNSSRHLFIVSASGPYLILSACHSFLSDMALR